MSLHTVRHVAGGTPHLRRSATESSHRGFAVGLLALAGVLVVNTLLGPLGTDTIE